jgi:hypothetical protein
MNGKTLSGTDLERRVKQGQMFIAHGMQTSASDKNRAYEKRR